MQLSEAARMAIRCASVLGHQLGGVTTGIGEREVLLFCYRCGGFVAAKCGLLSEVCRRWPANVGAQSRLRGVHPARDVAVTPPWPVGRCPPRPTFVHAGDRPDRASDRAQPSREDRDGAAAGLPLAPWQGRPADAARGNESGVPVVARAVQASSEASRPPG